LEFDERSILRLGLGNTTHFGFVGEEALDGVAASNAPESRGGTLFNMKDVLLVGKKTCSPQEEEDAAYQAVVHQRYVYPRANSSLIANGFGALNVVMLRDGHRLIDPTLLSSDQLILMNTSLKLRDDNLCSIKDSMGSYVEAATIYMSEVATDRPDEDNPLYLTQQRVRGFSDSTILDESVKVWGSTLSALLMRGLVSALEDCFGSWFLRELDFALTGILPTRGIRYYSEETRTLTFDSYQDDNLGANTDSDAAQQEAASLGKTQVNNSIFSLAVGENSTTSAQVFFESEQRIRDQVLQRFMDGGIETLQQGIWQEADLLSQMASQKTFERGEKCMVAEWFSTGKYALVVYKVILEPDSVVAKFTVRAEPAASTSPSNNVVSEATLLAWNFSTDVNIGNARDLLPERFTENKNWYWMGDPGCAVVPEDTRQQIVDAMGEGETTLSSMSECVVPGYAPEKERVGERAFLVHDVTRADIGTGPFRRGTANAMFLELNAGDTLSTGREYDPNQTQRQDMFTYEEYDFQQRQRPVGWGFQQELRPSDLKPINPATRLRVLNPLTAKCSENLGENPGGQGDTCNFLDNFLPVP